MSELSADHLVVYALLIVVTMAMLEWVESKRTRTARARRDRRGQLEVRPPRSESRAGRLEPTARLEAA